MIINKKNHIEYLVRDKLIIILISQAFLILPLLLNLPKWLWLIWSFAALWRVQIFRGRWHMPGGIAKVILTVSSAGLLFASYSGKAGTETMVSLLVCAFSLKLLEMNSARDAQLLVLIGFIIAATQMLFSQTPMAAAYCLLCLFLLIMSLRALHLTETQSVKEKIKRSGMIFLHTLPVMFILFVVLPRIGPLWAIPNQMTATTGFSDTLSPGDLGNLALNNAPAFRVEFNGNIPPTKELYWRGLVLDFFDGRTWRINNPSRFLQTKQQIQNNNSATYTNFIDYSVIAEPHGQRWLFSLLTPTQVNGSVNPLGITENSLLMLRFPLAQRLAYTVTSALDTQWRTPPQLSLQERELNTRIPTSGNPKTRALAQQWQNKQLTQQEIINKILALYTQEFIYTLQPPRLGINSIDEFLFSTKQGFCEHYASSFSFLLRSAGIPARVVVGYQGGSWNPLENYLRVSQSDAHAWTEVWFEGQGWQTIDPTAAVAPNRIEQGISESLNENDQALVARAWRSRGLLSTLQLRWDAAIFAWQRWVLNYDNDAQEGLLTRILGGAESWRIAFGLIGLGLLGAGIFAFSLRCQLKPKPLRPEIIAMQKLEKKLLLMGSYKRKINEPVNQFLHRVCLAEPEYQASLQEIAQLFEQIAYQNKLEHRTNLLNAIKKF
jgi:protein-glutamine gamma-glutamyltransferase